MSQLWSVFVTADAPVAVKQPPCSRIELRNAALANVLVDSMCRSTLRLDYPKSPDTILPSERDQDSKELTMLCSLIPGRIEQCTLNIPINPGECVLSVIGQNDIYVTGVIYSVDEVKVQPHERRELGQPKCTEPKPSLISSSFFEQNATTSTPKGKERMKETAKYYNTVSGTGRPAERGDKVSVSYTVRTGTSSGPIIGHNGEQPVQLIVGQEHGIPGLGMGVKGMQINSQRQLFIPSTAGYGVEKAFGIPKNTDIWIGTVPSLLNRLTRANYQKSVNC
ncbi:hypothetical protein CPB83DRAFT_834689 [Crepidotus variabilis]|uniref:peptidylprolyl isomerase n=1 Tax=Crepidotus variabilis TaxID=179855 RepID=A0A9P6EJ99_9AGAR|nr:hypothetical protein CPB83DRAFT_834689 [Crepidotus variabilis]